MKHIIQNFIILFLITFISCNSPEKNKTAAIDEAITQTETSFEVDTINSSIEWVGTMVGIYKHNGLVGIKEGNLSWNGNSFYSGQFTVNMKSITYSVRSMIIDIIE